MVTLTWPRERVPAALGRCSLWRPGQVTDPGLQVAQGGCKVTLPRLCGQAVPEPHLLPPGPRAQSPLPRIHGECQRDPWGMPLTGSVLFPVIPLLYLLFLHLPPPLLGRDRLPRFHGNTPPLPSFLQRGFHPFLSKIAIFSHGFPFSPSPHSASSSRFPRQAAPTRHP